MNTVGIWLANLIGNHLLVMLLYLLTVNLLTFLLFFIDKRKAIKNKQRIRESTLLLAAAAGGTIGALFSMQTFRHKTQHKKFTIGIPILLILQIAVLIAILLA
ncbi:MAG: DUF1294 domain-containing protein [Clostridiales bacterium]